MKIITGYLNRAIISHLGVVTLVFILICLSNQLARYLGSIALGKMAAGILFKTIALEMPRLIGMLLPVAFYFSVILAYSRFYSDS